MFRQLTLTSSSFIEQIFNTWSTLAYCLVSDRKNFKLYTTITEDYNELWYDYCLHRYTSLIYKLMTMEQLSYLHNCIQTFLMISRIKFIDITSWTFYILQLELYLNVLWICANNKFYIKSKLWKICYYESV